MKKTLSIVACAFLALQLSAKTFYDQLCEYNFNWKKYAVIAQLGEARNIPCDQVYVRSHLSCVIGILQNAPVDHLTEAQKASRVQMISLLDQYRLAGNFPVNYYRMHRTPVFIDE